MGRRVTSGVVGGSGLGTINVVASTITTTTTNGDLTFEPNGTGRILFAKDAQLQTQNDLRFADADSSNWVALQAPATIATNYTLTLPNAVSGTNGFALTSDTSGNLSWSAAGAALTDNNTDSNINYLAFTTQTTGFLTAARVATATRPLTYQPSTGSMQVTSFGVGTAASGTAGEIRATNNITSFFSSDAAFKENIIDIPDALEKVSAIGGKMFNWKDSYIKDHGGLDDYFLRKQDYGVIAQDVLKVFPEAVRRRSDDSLAVDYSRLSALAFAAIVELKNLILLEKEHK
jgi:hypothetical protein